MANGHLGSGVPICGIIAAENRIGPTAVGWNTEAAKPLRHKTGAQLGNSQNLSQEKQVATVPSGTKVVLTNPDSIQHKRFY